MLTNETISKLQDMRLGVMAKQFKEQLNDPQFASMSFEDRLAFWWMLNGQPERVTTYRVS